MEALRTVKKCVLKNQSTLRMSLSIEGVWYIFLETLPNDSYNLNNPVIPHKEMLWNGIELHEANVQFENFKWNPMTNGGDYNKDDHN